LARRPAPSALRSDDDRRDQIFRWNATLDQMLGRRSPGHLAAAGVFGPMRHDHLEARRDHVEPLRDAKYRFLQIIPTSRGRGRLEGCSSDAAAVSRHIVGLSTYLGHARVTDTYWYLQASPALMTHIAAGGETLQRGEAQ
jgi:hypothetical protein